MKPDKDKEKPKSQSKKPDGKVFDVRRPGKAPASPTSRPVIVGHKPEAQQAQTAVSGVGEASPNPMLTRRRIQILPSGDLDVKEESVPAETAPAQEAASKAPSEETEALAATALDAVAGPPELAPEAQKQYERLPAQPKLTVQSLQSSAKPKPEVGKVETKAETDKVPAAPETLTELERQPKPEPPMAAAELPQDTTSVPEPGSEPEAPKVEIAIPSQEQEAEQAPEPVIEPLFDESGKIIVSTHDHRHRQYGLKVFALVLLILILAAVILDIVLDLGLLNIQGLPHTNFLQAIY